MIISNKYRFLFIHIPKTGGVAIEDAMSRYGRNSDKFAKLARNSRIAGRAMSLIYGPDVENKLNGMSVHARYHGVRSRLGKEAIDGLFSFAATRNPYTRAYAYYEHCRHLPGAHDHVRASRWTFEEFVASIVERDATQEKGTRTFPQLQFVADRHGKKILVDALLSYEQLDQDVTELSKHLNLPHPVKLKRGEEAVMQPAELAEAFGRSLSGFADFLANDFERLGYPVDLERCREAPVRPLLVDKEGA